ncbi:TraB/GumN family protein [Sneathiella sp.]|uniref:TraB/GumN family protein n=1 Tax=Sneathiella sp. TaxID=1964365 RepID=UPI00356B10E4
MNIFSRLVFCLTVLAFFTAPVPALARLDPPANCETRPFDKGRLWKVSDGNSPPSYIFGTMHSSDPRILFLPGVVMQAFNSASTAIFETSLNDDDLTDNQRFMLLPPGQSLKSKIGAARFQVLASIMSAYGVDAATLDRIKIWAAAAIISQPPPSRPGSAEMSLLDKELEKSARRSGKNVIALETNREQLDIFDTMPETVQLEYLDQSMDENKILAEELETITSYYLSGNTGWIACDLESSLTQASAAFTTIMTTVLISDRNRHMVERMTPELKRGNAFVGIGALHLPGKEGVLSLLENQGYKIERKY